MYENSAKHKKYIAKDYSTRTRTSLSMTRIRPNNDIPHAECECTHIRNILTVLRTGSGLITFGSVHHHDRHLSSLCMCSFDSQSTNRQYEKDVTKILNTKIKSVRNHCQMSIVLNKAASYFTVQ